jgi:hypothetical protein
VEWGGVDERLLLASERGDNEGVLLAQVAGQVVVAPVEAASRERRQPCRVATAERFAQAFERAVADAIEGEPEERIGDPQRPLQREVGVVGDPRAPIGRLERDPVERDDGRVLAPQRDGLARLELDDPVGERGPAAEESATRRNSVPSPTGASPSRCASTTPGSHSAVVEKSLRYANVSAGGRGVSMLAV